MSAGLTSGVAGVADAPPRAAVRRAAAPADALSARIKACYGAGALTESIKAYSFGVFLLFFYTTVLGLPGSLVGIATAVGLVWDSIIDPFVGHLSDRSASRLGRRHVFMIAGAFCMGTAFVAIFNPPAGMSPMGLFAWLVVTSVVLRTATSVFMVPYYALGAELSGDYDERTAVSAWRAGFALAGTLGAALASFLVFFRGSGASLEADPKFSPDGYGVMGMAFGVTMTLAGLTTVLGTPRAPAGQATDAGAPASRRFFRDLAEALRDRSFRLLVGSASLFFLASVINASLGLHYLTYYAGLPGSRAIAGFQLAFYAGALVGVPLWLRLAHRAEKHHLYVAATIVTAVMLACAYFLVGEGRLVGTGQLGALATGNAIAGLFASALWVLAPSMLADLAGRDASAAGRRRDGVFFGVYSFGQQAAAGVAILFAGVSLDRFAGLVPGVVAQAPRTIERLALLYAIVPAAILTIAAVLILRYELTRHRVAAATTALPAG